uniref:Ig-like domain-containing protein n=1 Tax=Leptobrachium leishanense TaxID=445787 RepID=A0A8C5QHJ4_9ANUR
MGSIKLATSGTTVSYSGKCIGRCELFANGTLRMDRLTVSDDGSYTVKIEGYATVTLQLKVYLLLDAPSLGISPVIHTEKDKNLNLQCFSGSQLVQNYYFYYNEKLMSCHLPHVSCNQASPFLYFNPITEEDSGKYTCAITNPVSRNTSSILNVKVLVRVSEVTLISNVSSPVLTEEDSVSLTCLAKGTDLSYTWSLEGAKLSQSSHYHLMNNNTTLIISPVSRNDKGLFSCTVSNSINSDTSNSLRLNWSPKGHIACTAKRFNTTLELGCSWVGGYPAADLQMTFENRTDFKYDQVTRNVSYPQTHPSTELLCQGTHWNCFETCTLEIDVPKSANVINNTLIRRTVGNNFVFNFTLISSKVVEDLHVQSTFDAFQILPAKFHWSRIEQNVIYPLLPGRDLEVISTNYTSYLVASSLAKELAGVYICKVENLMGSTVFSFDLSVAEDDERDISPGAVAGIAIATLVVGILGTTAVFLIYRKQCRQNQTSDTPGHGVNFKTVNVNNMPRPKEPHMNKLNIAKEESVYEVMNI